MIRFTTEDGNLVVVAEMKGYGIYRDNYSLIDLATGDAARQQRFVDAVHAKATLLFSWASAIEVAGPQGASAEAVRAFLDRIGPLWIPLQLNPWEVMKREQAGLAAEAAVSTKFMESYFQRRAYDLGESSTVIDLTREGFFQLGAVVDWVNEYRDKIRADAETIDNELRALLENRRAEYEKNPASLDECFRAAGSMNASQGPSCWFTYTTHPDQRGEGVSLHAPRWSRPVPCGSCGRVWECHHLGQAVEAPGRGSSGST